MAKRGRPVYSKIRQNIVEILYVLGKAYGYEIYKSYIRIFPKVTMRSIYYHLNKGVVLREFKVDEIKLEKGDYSWGEAARKIYYALGPNAKPMAENRVREILSKK